MKDLHIDGIWTDASGGTASDVLNPATGEVQIPIMPGFANTLSDRQLVALLTYLRSRFAGKSPWSDVGKSIGDVRAAQRECATCATGESR